MFTFETLVKESQGSIPEMDTCDEKYRETVERLGEVAISYMEGFWNRRLIVRPYIRVACQWTCSPCKTHSIFNSDQWPVVQTIGCDQLEICNYLQEFQKGIVYTGANSPPFKIAYYAGFRPEGYEASDLRKLSDDIVKAHADAYFEGWPRTTSSPGPLTELPPAMPEDLRDILLRAALYLIRERKVGLEGMQSKTRTVGVGGGVSVTTTANDKQFLRQLAKDNSKYRHGI